MRRKRRWSEIGTRDYALIYRKLKDIDVDKVMGQVMKGRLKAAGQCLAAGGRGPEGNRKGSLHLL